MGNFVNKKKSLIESEALIEKLPEDLVYYVFQYLNAKDLIKVSMTCTYLKEISKDPMLWKTLFDNKYPHLRYIPVPSPTLQSWKKYYHHRMAWEKKWYKKKYKATTQIRYQKGVNKSRFTTVNEIATCNWDRTLKLWSLTKQEYTILPTKPIGQVWKIYVSPQYSRLVSASDQNEIHLYELPPVRNSEELGEIIKKKFKKKKQKLKLKQRNKQKFQQNKPKNEIQKEKEKEKEKEKKKEKEKENKKVVNVEKKKDNQESQKQTKPKLENKIKKHKKKKKKKKKKKIELDPDTKLIRKFEQPLKKESNEKKTKNKNKMHKQSQTEKELVMKNTNMKEQNLNNEYKGMFLKHGVLSGHTSTIKCFKFDEEHLISGSSDCTVKIWDTQQKKCKSTIEHTDSIWTLDYLGDYLVTGSKDTAVRWWSLPREEMLDLLVGHTAPVSCIEYQNSEIVSGSYDSVIKLWDLRSFERCTATLEGHQGPISCLQLEGNLILSGSFDSTIKVWDRRKLTNLHTFREMENSWILSLQFKDGRLLTSSNNGEVKILDFRTKEMLEVEEIELLSKWSSQENILKK
ncbi:f-box/wd repeat-containing protein pof1 [Anaeramoeba flamelloides]|uniref:F-box/wd repeat-containing protein pof1 n=1 Tax=Anaeramoeba flamelloides TaxID=1746091 RepID=A0AAV7YUU8_9EUKA|nr:f-box/wd repeat-containing protein pof1 [Anaeramoeba flamelloides]